MSYVNAKGLSGPLKITVEHDLGGPYERLGPPSSWGTSLEHEAIGAPDVEYPAERRAREAQERANQILPVSTLRFAIGSLAMLGVYAAWRKVRRK